MKKTFFVSFLATTEALKCQSCTETFDHNGNPVGLIDNNCDTLTGVDYLTECPVGMKYCGTELIADWMPNGEQIFKYSRGCRVSGSEEPQSACTEGILTGMQYKDCVTTCSTDGCNNDQSVEDLFAKKDENGDIIERTCYSCSSSRDFEQSLIEGKPECFTTPVSEGSQRKCPKYANAACFKGKFIAGAEEEQHFKGCSAFDVPDDVEDGEAKCSEFIWDEHPVLGCKSSCSGNLCNELSVKGNGHMCYTCEVTFNQMGETVGWGDLGCVDDLAQRHLQFCQEDVKVCVTDFEADWRLNGQQTYTMRRGCGTSDLKPSQQPSCLSSSGNNGNFHLKYCSQFCDNEEEIACNNNNDIFKSFKQGRVESCKVCSDHLYDPGVTSDCAETALSVKCPEFADAACFNSRVTTEDATEPGLGELYSSDTFHGCSTFRITKDSKTCFNVETSEPQFGAPGGGTKKQSICKETCGDNDCNTGLTELPGGSPPDVISHHFCYSCSVTFDHLNNTIGNGDERCFDAPGPEHEIECPEGYNFCYSEMEVDWLAKGDQSVTVRRGCQRLPSTSTCTSGEIATVWQYKDCEIACSNNLLSACNGGLEMAELFREENPVDACFNCETHPDDDSCGDLTGPDASRNLWPCPLYAQKGCFTSITRHLENTPGVIGSYLVDDVIRGCSAFDKEYSCSVQHETDWGSSNSVEFTTCKDSCTEFGCNNNEPEVKLGEKCYVCSLTLDAQGRQVGLGDPGCLTPAIDAEHYWDCGYDSVCATHMEAVWLPMGNQEIIIERKCAKKEGTPNLCKAGGSNAWMFKDCWEHCEGKLCNDNLDISKNFQPGPGEDSVAECHTCKHEEIIDGQVSDIEIEDFYDCKGIHHGTSDVVKAECPPWARLGCFIGDGVQRDPHTFEEAVNVYRGCSSFLINDDIDQLCSSLTFDTNVEEDFERTRTSICKVSCHDADDCNTYRFPDWQEPGEGECPTCTPPTTTDESTLTTLTTSTTEPSTESTTTKATTVSSTQSSTEESTTTDEPITETTPSSATTTTIFSTVLTTLILNFYL